MGLFLCKLLYNMKRNILTTISVLAILFPIYILTNSFFFSEDEKKEENENTLNESKSITCSKIKIDKFKTNIDFSGKVISANKIPISSEGMVFLVLIKMFLKLVRNLKKEIY